MDELVAAMFQQIVDLKTNGPTAEEVATVQEQLQRSWEEAEQNNDFWLSQLEYYFTTPSEDPQEILEHGRWVDSITPAGLQAVAHAALPEDRYVKVVLYPENSDWTLTPRRWMSNWRAGARPAPTRWVPSAVP